MRSRNTLRNKPFYLSIRRLCTVNTGIVIAGWQIYARFEYEILEEASIEPHLLARACNDVREGGQDVPVLLRMEELERYLG